MGIDIYLRWHGQSEEEEKAQYTGFSTEAGKVGYLREAYHGAPYVTKYFLQEAFDSESGVAPIAASVLRERLPIAVTMAMFRHHNLYGKGKDPANIEIAEHEDLIAGLSDHVKNIFTNEVNDATHKKIAEEMSEATIKNAEMLIDGGMLPAYAQSYVDFCELAEAKEKLIGKPCEIVASY